VTTLLLFSQKLGPPSDDAGQKEIGLRQCPAMGRNELRPSFCVPEDVEDVMTRHRRSGMPEQRESRVREQTRKKLEDAASADDAADALIRRNIELYGP